MAKSKALRPSENTEVRSLVRAVLDAHFSDRGRQRALAKESGLSQGYISDVTNGKRGGGVELLRALAKYRPVEIVRLLGISQKTLLALWVEREGAGEENLVEVSDTMRRAARAAVELWGCTPGEALAAVESVVREDGELTPDSTADALLLRMNSYLPKRTKSGPRLKAQRAKV